MVTKQRNVVTNYIPIRIHYWLSCPMIRVRNAVNLTVTYA